MQKHFAKVIVHNGNCWKIATIFVKNKSFLSFNWVAWNLIYDTVNL